MRVFTAELFEKHPRLLARVACTSQIQPICLNQGICIDLGRVVGQNLILEKCICKTGSFGPNCEYNDEFLLEDADLAKPELITVKSEVTETEELDEDDNIEIESKD